MRSDGASERTGFSMGNRICSIGINTIVDGIMGTQKATIMSYLRPLVSPRSPQATLQTLMNLPQLKPTLNNNPQLTVKDTTEEVADTITKMSARGNSARKSAEPSSSANKTKKSKSVASNRLLRKESRIGSMRSVKRMKIGSKGRKNAASERRKQRSASGNRREKRRRSGRKPLSRPKRTMRGNIGSLLRLGKILGATMVNGEGSRLQMIS